MSCRKCVDSCQCSVVGNTGITVTGVGSAADPYSVTVDICEINNAITEQDRAATTTDWLVGEDSTGNCLKIRAPEDVHIQSFTYNPITGQLTVTETNGLNFVTTIPAGYGSLADDGNAGFTLTDGGGATYTVSICDLIDDIASAVQVSTDEVLAKDVSGNCKFIPVPLETPLALTTDGNGTGVTLGGTSNHTVNIRLLSGQTPNAATLGSDGGIRTPRVAYTDSVDATYDSGTNEWRIIRPSGGGHGTAADTFTADQGCGIANGSKIYANAAQQLVGPPEHTTVVLGRPATANVATVTTAQGNVSGTLTTATSVVTNPSPCRDMRLLINGRTTATVARVNGTGVSGTGTGQCMTVMSGATTFADGTAAGPSYGLNFTNPIRISDHQSYEGFIAAGGSDTFSVGTRVGAILGNVTSTSAAAHVTGIGSTV
jgi:hypothetical protein